MNAPDLARFLPSSYDDERDQYAEARAQRERFDLAQESALAAMRAGVAGHLVCDLFSPTESLAAMLSAHTCDYRTDVAAPTPGELLAAMLAAALERGCPKAEQYAQRIAVDYALAHEVPL